MRGDYGAMRLRAFGPAAVMGERYIQNEEVIIDVFMDYLCT